MKGGNDPVMHSLSGVTVFNSLTIYKKLQTLTLSGLPVALCRCWTHFDKIGQIGLKPATFIVTCKPGLAVGLDEITRA